MASTSVHLLPHGGTVFRQIRFLSALKQLRIEINHYNERRMENGGSDKEIRIISIEARNVYTSDRCGWANTRQRFPVRQCFLILTFFFRYSPFNAYTVRNIHSQITVYVIL